MKERVRMLMTSITVLVFSCVMSCDEHDERLETRVEPSMEDVTEGSDASRSMDGAAYNGLEGDALDLATAKRWTSNYRKSITKPDQILSHYFGNEIIHSILNESDCVGIRIYYALDDRGERKLLLVGVDRSGNDLLPSESGKIGEEENIIGDYSYPCPDRCAGNGL